MKKSAFILNKESINAVNSFYELQDVDAEEVLRVTKDPAMVPVDEPTYARLKDIEFKEGIIEVEVLSRLLPDAPEFARGFIGVAFHIDRDDRRFEGLYIRPGNSRNENQERRNRSTQYFSYPEYKFDRFRQECPGRYESYADMGLDEWIQIKIVVEGEQAQLYLNHSQQPVLVVNDLKHGGESTGGIGLWVDIGTEGFFKNLQITEL